MWAIVISQLSTVEFVYNGVEEKYSDESPKEAEYYISYNVEVGIQMKDVEVKIDEWEKSHIICRMLTLK